MYASKRIIYLNITWIFFLIIACNKQKPILHFAKTFPNATWTYRDSVKTNFQVIDTTLLYSLWVTIQHSAKYEGQNVYVKVGTTFPDGMYLSKSVSFELCDDTGRWLGEKKGDQRFIHIPLQENAYFKKTGNYTFHFSQFSRSDSLKGIEKFQFEIYSQKRQVVKK